jgi:transcriptional regulator with XRE-family HTH domain
MAIRHLSDSRTAVAVPTVGQRKEPAFTPPPRRVSPSDVANLGRYALIAFGIAESIRHRRESLGLPLTEFARQLGVDPSHVSRIENADTNPSLVVLSAISSALGLSLRQLLTPPRWAFTADWPNSDPLGSAGEASSADISHGHALHHRIVTVPAKGFSRTLGITQDFVTCIALDGEAIVRFRIEGQEQSEFLGEAGVVHARNLTELALKATQGNAKVLVLGSGTNCFCRDLQ